MLARYNTDGSLDMSFGAGGTSHHRRRRRLRREAPASRSRPTARSSSSATPAGAASNDNFDFAVARYNTDGSLDTSFGNGGKVTTDFAALADVANAVAIQTDGKIVVVGKRRFRIASGTRPTSRVARYNANGTPDTSFGSGGKLTTDVAAAPNRAASRPAIRRRDRRFGVLGARQLAGLGTAAWRATTTTAAPTAASATAAR